MPSSSQQTSVRTANGKVPQNFTIPQGVSKRSLENKVHACLSTNLGIHSLNLAKKSHKDAVKAVQVTRNYQSIPDLVYRLPQPELDLNDADSGIPQISGIPQAEPELDLNADDSESLSDSPFDWHHLTLENTDTSYILSTMKDTFPHVQKLRLHLPGKDDTHPGLSLCLTRLFPNLENLIIFANDCSLEVSVASLIDGEITFPKLKSVKIHYHTAAKEEHKILVYLRRSLESLTITSNSTVDLCLHGNKVYHSTISAPVRIYNSNVNTRKGTVTPVFIDY